MLQPYSLEIQELIAEAIKTRENPEDKTQQVVLALYRNLLSLEEWLEVLGYLKDRPEITCLEVRECELEDEQLELIARSLPRSIQELCLESEQECVKGVEAISQLPLNTLSLKNNLINKNTVHFFTTTPIRHLDFSYSALTDGDAAPLFMNPNIEKINLKYTPIGNKSLVTLRGNTTLKYLNLELCIHINYRAMAYLQDHPNLETLLLRDNRRIGDLGIQLLCEGKNQLRHLKIYQIGMTEVGARMLLQKLTLEYIDIGANHIYDDELLQLIIRQIPKANLAPRAMETKTYCSSYDRFQPTNEAGQLIDDRGRAINFWGQLLDSKGRAINEAGQLIDDEYRLINEAGQLIDETGAVIEEYDEESEESEEGHAGFSP